MKQWHTIALTVLNFLLAGYLILAMTTFNQPDNSDLRCEDIEINIEEGNTNGFLTKKSITQMLQQNHISIIGCLPDSINIRKVEDVLKASPLVKSVDCSITTEGKLCIDVTQRLPIVRIKTSNSDYYIDDAGNIMPSTNYHADLIIATGSISKNYAQRSLYPLVSTINDDELWLNQIEQINILPDKGVELVPRVGNHVVYLGQLPTGNSIEQDSINSFVRHKLERLDKFYRFGLSEVGWDRYSYINLEYDNQIICKQ